MKGSKWSWTNACEEAFREVKRLVTSDLVLMHYNPELSVSLACDASAYGLGCVLSHVLPGGQERPIAFASRTLNAAERRYSQKDKGALSIVWRVKKCYMYLYGRHFRLITDHKPLLSILSAEQGTNATTAARLQGHALFLAGHDYEIIYKNTK